MIGNSRLFGAFVKGMRLALWIAGLWCLATLGTDSGSTLGPKRPQAPADFAAPEPLAGNVLGGRLWTHLDEPGRGRVKFRMYQFNPTGNDGRGTGWYHEGDFTEWMTETLHYTIRGDELILDFDLARERASIRFRVERARGPHGADLRFTLLPDPRRYWKPYEYWASSRRTGLEDR